MVKVIKQFWNDESGQGLPEYALLVAAVVVMVILATSLFAEPVRNLFASIGQEISAENAIANPSVVGGGN